MSFGCSGIAALPSTTLVTVIDVSDRTAPRIVQTTSMEGRYVDSRGVGDFVYVLVTTTTPSRPAPRIIVDDPDEGERPAIRLRRLRNADEYLARVTANPGEMIDGGAAELHHLRRRRRARADRPAQRAGRHLSSRWWPNAHNLISVVSFNVESDEPGLAVHVGRLQHRRQRDLRVARQFLRLRPRPLGGRRRHDADHEVRLGPGDRRRRLRRDDDRRRFDPEPVLGRRARRLLADCHDDRQPAARATGRAARENVLFVLQEDDGVFEFVGSLQNLALDETMRSVRFMGDRAFVTTFRTIDPLFGIDLSDPTQPAGVGHLTLPGFSSYMQLIDDDAPADRRAKHAQRRRRTDAGGRCSTSAT